MSIWWFSRILGEIFFQDLKKPGKGGKGERSSEGEPSPCQEEGEEEGEEAAEGGAGEGEEQGGEGEGAGGEEEEGEEVEATVRLPFAQYNQNVCSSVLVFQVRSECTNSVFLFSPLQPEYSGVAVLVFFLNCEYNFLCFKPCSFLFHKNPCIFPLQAYAFTHRSTHVFEEQQEIY